MKTLCSVMLAAFSLAAHGTVIESPGDPLLTGATVITFSEFPLGTTNPSISGVSFAGDGATTEIVTSVGNADTPDLNNNDVNVEILFATAVTAFGMDILFADQDVTVEAYNASGGLLGSAVLLSPTESIVSGFRGIGGVGPIASARVVVNDEFIRIDNFSFVTGTVPEPATVALLGLGLAGLGWSRRRTH